MKMDKLNVALFKGHLTSLDEWANCWGNNSQKRFIDIGCSCESLHVISEFFAFGILISIYTVTNPSSQKCENHSEPNQLREDLDSEKYFSKYQQLLILSVDFKIIVLSSPGNALFFLFIFQIIYMFECCVWGRIFLSKSLDSKDTNKN